MRNVTPAILACLLLAGCATQTKFAGRPPSFRGEAAESVWRDQLAKTPLRNQTKATVRASRSCKIGHEGILNPAKPGQTVSAPALITTGKNGQLDLFIGDNGPVVRVTEDASVNIVRLNYERARQDGPKTIETLIELLDGKILGNVKPLEAGSIYMIRTQAGVIQIRGTQFEIASTGETHIIEGEAEVFAGGKRIIVKTGQSFFPNSGLTVGDAS